MFEILLDGRKLLVYQSGTDPGLGGGGQHTILPNFGIEKNLVRKGVVDPPLPIYHIKGWKLSQAFARQLNLC